MEESNYEPIVNVCVEPIAEPQCLKHLIFVKGLCLTFPVRDDEFGKQYVSETEVYLLDKDLLVPIINNDGNFNSDKIMLSENNGKALRNWFRIRNDTQGILIWDCAKENGKELTIFVPLSN